MPTTPSHVTASLHKTKFHRRPNVPLVDPHHLSDCDQWGLVRINPISSIIDYTGAKIGDYVVLGFAGYVPSRKPRNAADLKFMADSIQSMLSGAILLSGSDPPSHFKPPSNITNTNGRNISGIRWGAAWLVQCECGVKQIKRQHHLVRLSTCHKCRTQNETYHIDNPRLYARWTTMRKNGLLCDRWAGNFSAFVQETGATDADYVYTRTTGDEIGPDNFQLVGSYGSVIINGRTYTIGEIAHLHNINRQSVSLRRKIIIKRGEPIEWILKNSEEVTLLRQKLKWKKLHQICDSNGANDSITNDSSGASSYFDLIDVPPELERPDIIRDYPRSTKTINYAGHRLGSYEVVGFIGFLRSQPAWLIKCKCGHMTISRSNSLINLDKCCKCRKVSRQEGNTKPHMDIAECVKMLKIMPDEQIDDFMDGQVVFIKEPFCKCRQRLFAVCKMHGKRLQHRTLDGMCMLQAIDTKQYTTNRE